MEDYPIPGKHIWLFGGGKLFRSLAEPGMVDTVEFPSGQFCWETVIP